MSEKLIIEQFLDLNKLSRLEALKYILTYHEIKHRVIPCQHDCNNVFVKLTEEKPYRLLVAHYDIVKDSTGINDNTAALALLINIIKESKEKNFNVLFTDKEESGMIGSYQFSKVYGKDIKEAIIFDIIGFGDTIVYGSFGDFDNLSKVGIKEISSFLPSDNVTFKSNNVKTALITAAHKEDLTLIKENYYSLNAKAKFYESFHNRQFDNNINLINFDLITELKDKMLKML